MHCFFSVGKEVGLTSNVRVKGRLPLLMPSGRRQCNFSVEEEVDAKILLPELVSGVMGLVCLNLNYFLNLFEDLMMLEVHDELDVLAGRLTHQHT